MPDDLDVLRTAKATREAIYTVHYACQNLTEVKEGPAQVYCVAFWDVNSGASTAFSSSTVGAADTTPTEREKLILAGALRFMREQAGARWVHWKMSRPEYGFEALSDRLRWIAPEEALSPPPADRRYDLDAIVADRYGRDYAPHPRLPNLIARNGLATRNARWAADEPALATQGQHLAIQQSATEKVRLLAELLDRLLQGRLQTENSAGEVSFAGAHLDAVRVVLALGDKFLLVSRAIKRRHGGRPTLELNDEYDTQDLMRGLLVQFFDDVRDEEWSPSYAGGGSRIDFLLPQTRLAVELKMTRASMSAKELGEQLIVDREKYERHPDVGHLVCLVFDHEGRLPNPRGIEQDLDRTAGGQGLSTTVKIIDR
ncbi:PD-(D/E)XK nuclease domain-containing protein [Blastococcus sp. SYSU DS1021]